MINTYKVTDDIPLVALGMDTTFLIESLNEMENTYYE